MPAKFGIYPPNAGGMPTAFGIKIMHKNSINLLLHTVAFETYQTAIILYNRFGPTHEGVHCTRYVRRAVTLFFGYVPIYLGAGSYKIWSLSNVSVKS